MASRHPLDDPSKGRLGVLTATFEGAEARFATEALFSLSHEREEIRQVAVMAPRRATFEVALRGAITAT